MTVTPHQALIAQIEAFVDKILNLEKGHRIEVEGQRIYPSEIHLLLLIDARPELNATGLAEHSGLTKGAVSQTLTRLERKGVLIKARGATSRNELLLGITSRGRKILTHFRGVQEDVRSHYDQILASFDASELDVIGRFLSRLREIHGRFR